MNFKELMGELKSLNLPRDQFAVASSGAMAAREIREANDFDILVTKSLWVELSKKHKINEEELGGNIAISKNVEAMGASVVNFDEAETQIRNAEVIDGVRFVKLSDVKIFKKRLGRKKDLADIKLIDEYLEEKG